LRRKWAEITIARTASRTVLGMMNDFAFAATFYLPQMSLPETTVHLAETPCSPIDRLPLRRDASAVRVDSHQIEALVQQDGAAEMTMRAHAGTKVEADSTPILGPVASPLIRLLALLVLTGAFLAAGADEPPQPGAQHQAGNGEVEVRVGVGVGSSIEHFSLSLVPLILRPVEVELGTAFCFCGPEGLGGMFYLRGGYDVVHVNRRGADGAGWTFQVAPLAGLVLAADAGISMVGLLEISHWFSPHLGLGLQLTGGGVYWIGQNGLGNSQRRFDPDFRAALAILL
jgi:hypothetical protein